MPHDNNVGGDLQCMPNYFPQASLSDKEWKFYVAVILGMFIISPQHIWAEEAGLTQLLW
jgi:hypothetical protein